MIEMASLVRQEVLKKENVLLDGYCESLQKVLHLLLFIGDVYYSPANFLNELNGLSVP